MEWADFLFGRAGSKLKAIDSTWRGILPLNSMQNLNLTEM
jgi:hypothetical protein